MVCPKAEMKRKELELCFSTKKKGLTVFVFAKMICLSLFFLTMAADLHNLATITSYTEFYKLTNAA